MVGLGNPENEYAGTRHNVGFMVLDRIAEKVKAGFKETICNSAVARTKVNDEELVLAKPRTYMNRSGGAVAALLREFSLEKEELTVIHDDIDIALGKIKEKTGGGSAGHNGIESVAAALGSEDFRRIRIGVGRPPKGTDPADYVLSAFEADELETVDQVLEQGYKRAIDFS